MTCLPLCPKTEVIPRELSQAMAFFPLAGLAIALFPAIFILVFYPFLSPLLGSLVVIFIFTAVTGGFHLDGLADTVDGLAGGKDRKAILAIMRDGRIGSIGVIALIFIISFKIVLLNEVWIKADRANLLMAVFLFPVMSRWSMVCAAWLLSYAREEEGVGKVFAKEVTIREWLFSTSLSVFTAFFILRLHAFLFLTLVVLTNLFLMKYFSRRVGGVTGDVFGAINEIMEAASLGYILLFYEQSYLCRFLYP